MTKPPDGSSRGFDYTLTEEGEAALDGDPRDQKALNPNGKRGRSKHSSRSQRVPTELVDRFGTIDGFNSGSAGFMNSNGGSGSDGGAWRAPPEPDTGDERDQASEDESGPSGEEKRSPEVPVGGV